MKESGLRIRVDTPLRKEFIDTCHALDQTAAQVLRAYMRDFVESNSGVLQNDIFDGIPNASDSFGTSKGMIE